MTIYKALKKDSNAIILDVRENYEFKEGHIQDAVHIPLNFLEDRAEEELLDFNQPIYVYCRSGVRSKVGCHILETLGYTKTYNLGGILDWPEEIVC
ncbi:MAG: rhodanese-like domain-containing protein [Niameybacter sp.]|uniref:rhodanese-like domain-containing protein n=1 Tax=Niameybacter sp. TaxID=2033640 RepID=UPI002FC68771